MHKNLISFADLDPFILEKILKFNGQDLQNFNLNRKVLGLLFLNESTRTSSSLKSSFIRLGGGWISIEGSKGTYLEKKSDSIERTLYSLFAYSDILAVRGDIDIRYFNGLKIPIINAGNDFVLTPIWGIWLAFLLSKTFDDLKNLKIGTYGLAMYSTPLKSYYNALSYFNITFFEDSIIPEAGSDDEIILRIRQNGSQIIASPIYDFINDIYFLIIIDAIPPIQYDKELYKNFLKHYKPINNEIISKLNAGSYFFYVEPNVIPQLGKTIHNEIINDTKALNDKFNELSVICNYGVFNYLLTNQDTK